MKISRNNWFLMEDFVLHCIELSPCTLLLTVNSKNLLTVKKGQFKFTIFNRKNCCYVCFASHVSTWCALASYRAASRLSVTDKRFPRVRTLPTLKGVKAVQRWENEEDFFSRILRGVCQLCKYSIETSYRADFLREPSLHHSKHFGVLNF